MSLVSSTERNQGRGGERGDVRTERGRVEERREERKEVEEGGGMGE